MKLWTPTLALGISLLFALQGCTDDTAGTDCPSGQVLDQVSHQCVPIQCPSGTTLNPITEQCQTSDGTTVDPVEPGDNTGTGQDNSGDNDGTNSGINDGNNAGNNSGNNSGDNSGNNAGNNSGNNGGTVSPSHPIDPPYDVYEPQEPATAQYHSCDSADFTGVTPPRFVHHQTANYLLAAHPAVDVSAIDGPTAIDGHFMEDGSINYAGFIIGLSPPTGQSTPDQAATWVFNQIDTISDYSATRQGTGNAYLTHDNYPASTLNHVALSTTVAPHEARDRILGAVMGIATGDLDHDLPGATQADGSGLHLVYKVVGRTAQEVIIVGGITTTDLHEDPGSEARFAVQDLAGGTSLAPSGETMSEQCVSLEIRDVDEVDIIISMDASGSMDDVNAGISDFADELVDLLNATGIDWRVAVTGVDCHEIREDSALSPEFRALWPDPDDWESEAPEIPGFDGSGFFPDDLDTPCRNPDFDTGLPFPIPMDDDNNGRLMGDFTTDANEIRNQISKVSKTGLEYTLTMGIAALDHSLPRADNDGRKLRTNAAPMVIAVTDENEQLFKDAFGGFIANGNDPLSSEEMATLTNFIQPWLNYINRPDLRATISGLYWVPGTECAGGIDVGHGIHYVVEQTGGVFDSICDPDIGTAFGQIAEAAQDLVTGLYLIGRPVATTVSVDLESVADGSLSPMNRNISDGFDFDPTSNSLFFEGPSAPEEGQRVVVPYLQWDGTVLTCDDNRPCPAGMDCIKGSCLTLD